MGISRSGIYGLPHFKTSVYCLCTCFLYAKVPIFNLKLQMFVYNSKRCSTLSRLFFAIKNGLSRDNSKVLEGVRKQLWHSSGWISRQRSWLRRIDNQRWVWMKRQMNKLWSVAPTFCVAFHFTIGILVAISYVFGYAIGWMIELTLNYSKQP